MFFYRKDDKILFCIDIYYGIGLMGWMSEGKLGGVVGYEEIFLDSLSKYCIFNVGDVCV